MAWLYRWQGHEIRVQIRRGSRPGNQWERLYVDGSLSAERRGWHLFPVTLSAKVASAGGGHQEVRARVAWGKCRIWIDSDLAVCANAGRWFWCAYEGHEIELLYREWVLWRRARLYIDGQLVDDQEASGLPRIYGGRTLRGQLQRADGSVVEVKAMASSGDGLALYVDSKLVVQAGGVLGSLG
jgi:hypothetical protein